MLAKISEHEWASAGWVLTRYRLVKWHGWQKTVGKHETLLPYDLTLDHWASEDITWIWLSETCSRRIEFTSIMFAFCDAHFYVRNQIITVFAWLFIFLSENSSHISIFISFFFIFSLCMKSRDHFALLIDQQITAYFWVK